MSKQNFIPKSALSKAVNFKHTDDTRFQNQKSKTYPVNTLTNFQPRKEKCVHQNDQINYEVKAPKTPRKNDTLFLKVQKCNNTYSGLQNDTTYETDKVTNLPHRTTVLENSNFYANQITNKKISSTDDQRSTQNRILLNEEQHSAEVIDRKIVHLIGYVENVIRWSQILKNINVGVIYNVIGNFVNVLNGIRLMEKYVYIQGKNGAILECSYFEIDRPFPKISKGQFIGCLGQINNQKLKLYNVQILEENQKSDIERAIFFSQRMILALKK